MSNNEFKSFDINIDISSTLLRDKLDLSYIPDIIKDDVKKELEKLKKGKF